MENRLKEELEDTLSKLRNTVHERNQAKEQTEKVINDSIAISTAKRALEQEVSHQFSYL